MTCIDCYEYSYDEILHTLKENLVNGNVDFEYTAIDFPTFTLTTKINNKHCLKMQFICYADSVWRGYYREIILKGVRISKITINDAKNNLEALASIDKQKLSTSDFISELSVFLTNSKNNCDKLQEKGFVAWSIDKREIKKEKTLI